MATTKVGRLEEPAGWASAGDAESAAQATRRSNFSKAVLEFIIGTVRCYSLR